MEKIRQVEPLIRDGICEVIAREEGALIEFHGVEKHLEALVWASKSRLHCELPGGTFVGGRMSRGILAPSKIFNHSNFDIQLAEMFSELKTREALLVITFYCNKGGEEYEITKKIRFKLAQ